MDNKVQPIEICFIAPKAYPMFNAAAAGVFGGAEVDLYFLATELAKDESFSISLIAADYGQEEIETIENVRIIKSVNFRQNPLAGAAKIWQALRRADAGMYMMKTMTPGVFLAAFFCRVHHKMFLYRTANTDVCDGTYLQQHRWMGRLFKWSWRSAKLIFVQNAADKKNLENSIGLDSVAIPNGHRLTPPVDRKRDTVLWIGRSADIKRPGVFVDLAEKFPTEKFTMICQHATGDRKYSELMARAQQVKNLEFIERVSFDQVNSYFQRAKVFVNTSCSEGFPNTFIQAAQCGTSILALNVNPDGFLDKYSCGINSQNDIQKLAENLRFMLDDDRYIELGRNGRKYAEQNHDIKTIVEQYKKIFRSLAC